MLCYRDRTYCSFHTNCKGAEGCDRALTPAVKAGAEKSGLPISQYANPPKCFDPINVWSTRAKQKYRKEGQPSCDAEIGNS